MQDSVKGMNTPPLPSASAKPTSPEKARLEAILEHFKTEFPLDPVTPLGQFFAKPSHTECNGRGLLTYLTPAEPAGAELRLCGCARKRRDRFVANALLFEAARDQGGVAFAEGISAALKLHLPTNPRRQEQLAALAQARGQRLPDASPEPARSAELRSESAS